MLFRSFKAGGIQYEILGVNKNDISIRRATADDSDLKINNNLDTLAAAGEKLISAVDKVNRRRLII